LPEILPTGYPGLLGVRAPKEIAEALLNAMTEDGGALRELFLKNYTLDSHLANLAKAIHSVEQDDSRPVPLPIPTT
jgi:hypothetical protein